MPRFRRPRRRSTTIVAPLVIGRDTADIEGITRDMLPAVHLLGRNGPFVYAFSGIEIALWDIRGQTRRKATSCSCSAAAAKARAGMLCQPAALRRARPRRPQYGGGLCARLSSHQAA